MVRKSKAATASEAERLVTMLAFLNNVGLVVCKVQRLPTHTQQIDPPDQDAIKKGTWVGTEFRVPHRLFNSTKVTFMDAGAHVKVHETGSTVFMVSPKIRPRIDRIINEIKQHGAVHTDYTNHYIPIERTPEALGKYLAKRFFRSDLNPEP